MDVRCEKCQTEYELDEARLKPGGVTVKCTNCGHMFKIRKRAITNVGTPPTGSERPKTTSNRPPPQARADSILADDEAPTTRAPGSDGPTTVERQWLVRLENGEQKSCRELATLQQWIVSSVVSRESLISRTGKTWKRLGDIAELAQYFDIADEARTTRDERRAAPTPQAIPIKGTMLGLGGAPAAAGGTILPDDEDGRSTGNYAATGGRRPATQPPPLPGKVATKTPPLGSNANQSTPVPTRRPLTQPPPPPAKKTATGPVAHVPPAGPPEPAGHAAPPTDGRSTAPAFSSPSSNRATAAWATDGADKVTAATAGNPIGGTRPFVGKLSAIPDEPAFAGRVRMSPQDESSFETGKVRLPADDEDDLLPRRRGSGFAIIVLAILLVGGALGAAIYFFVIKKSDDTHAQAPADAAPVASVADAAPVVVQAADAPEAPKLGPVEAARAELATDNEARLKTAFDTLAGKDEPDALAVRAHLAVALAQALTDRAGLVADKAEADKLRKEAKAITLDAATAAQKAQKASPDDPGANLALAHVLRLQGKSAKDVRRYIDTARAKPGDWLREAALAEALLLARDGKLDDAKTLLSAIDSNEGRLEVSNDVRARFHLALIAYAQGKPADAKPLVDQILAAQPEHAGAKALAGKLDTSVVKTDPLPPEDPGKGSGSPGAGSNKPPVVVDNGATAGDYDGLVRKGDQVANTNCTRASELYLKALEKKPNGVEALTGLGYCALDQKNFATAHSRFRTALATSSRYEPALAGIAEAYQQQGRKDDAIAAWRRYLDAYPGAKKATAALERLGASGDGGSTPTPPNPGGGAGSSEPTPPPPPQPTPGSGSG